ncbi:hypothetical protein GCM10027346_40480 [Hymenobacter seoulensis]
MLLVDDDRTTNFLNKLLHPLKRERADLVAWLATMMEEFHRWTYHPHLHLNFDATTALRYVEMAINKLQQVFHNLISIAIKFTLDGGHINVGVARRGEQAVVTISDTGIGIPQELPDGPARGKDQRPGRVQHLEGGGLASGPDYLGERGRPRQHLYD